MSSPGNVAVRFLGDADHPAPVIPSITGSPQLDTLIRYGLIAGSTALTAIIVTWLNAHGFSDPNLSTAVGAAVLGVLGVIATAAWGFLNNRIIKTAVVEHVVTAAMTGNVPVAVAAAATPEQEVRITDALNSAQLKVKT